MDKDMLFSVSDCLKRSYNSTAKPAVLLWCVLR